jgi:hypothetical protein
VRHLTMNREGRGTVAVKKEAGFKMLQLLNFREQSLFRVPT